MPQEIQTKEDILNKLTFKFEKLMAEVLRLQKEGRSIRAELRKIKDEERAKNLLQNINE